ncbi:MULTISPECIES: helix-turn-helix domain-containing protein [Clostridium]|uniref:helix-turn-helix domain-containing protein n=1 Tax=Clostridium TaxID=1485 RepID=UPI002256DC7F|nr:MULTISPECIES: transcriptional regulator [Clostridium]UZT07880.1 transcriptional regulator [Clostridium sp. LQ25]
MFSVLKEEMKKKNITNSFLSKKLNISVKSLFNKMHGTTEFTLSEVLKIKQIVAPNKKLEDLFKTVDEKEVS